MKTEHENPPSAGPINADLNDDIEGEGIAFDLQAMETQRSALALLVHLGNIKVDDETLDKTALNLYHAAIESGSCAVPPDFSMMLATSSRILNAAFEEQIIKSQTTRLGRETVELALKTQSQLVRTIGAWSRLKSLQKKFQTAKTN